MNESYPTDDRAPEVSSGGMNLGDLYYVFFRHKWKIVLIFLASLVGAVTFYFTRPASYISEAVILIRYIVETKAPSRAAENAQVKSPDSQGNSIIVSEIEILTSLDLAALVADAIGPEKVLAKASGGTGRMEAAGLIRENLRVDVAKNSTSLRISFRHPDASMVQVILTQIVDTYKKRHVEIHQGTGVLDTFLLSQADQLRSRLGKTDSDLKKLKNDAKVISLEEDKRAYIDRIGKIRMDLMEAQAELAQRRSLIEAMRQAQQAPPVAVGTSSAGPVVTTEQALEYTRVGNYVESLQKSLAELRTRYTEEHPLVITTRQKLADFETQKQRMEAAHAGLGRMSPELSLIHTTNTAAGLASEILRVAEMETRVNFLADQLRQFGDEAARIIEAEPQILELQRQKQVDEEKYRYYNSALERAHLDESTGAGKITNIQVIQTPSPPMREIGGLKKPLMMILAFGCFGGFGWGFLWEKVINRSIRRVADVEQSLNVPLFISVPDTSWGKGSGSRRKQRRAAALPTPTAGEVEQPAEGSLVPKADEEVRPWDPQHALRPYFEGLRDRLITYFEVRKMTHKPKLVAVTSCRHGAGVSTMAAGLAATLSETGDGNVLLVDMNIDRGAVHPFRQGLPGCALSEALEQATREPAQIQNNLYVVSAREPNSAKLPSVLPRRFAHLVPKMKASDYDYIIFDMPPVSQTSVTARLSGFMDMMLIVIESEKTGQEIVQRASGLLNESRANLAAVLNKHRAYVPPALSQEL